jgi:hypothetical protein
MDLPEINNIRQNNTTIKTNMETFMKAIDLVSDKLSQKIEAENEYMQFINKIYTDSLDNYHIIAKNFIKIK